VLISSEQSASSNQPRATSDEQPATSNPHPAILYDGQCGLCINSIKWVRRLDWRRKFVLRDVNQRDAIARDYPGLDPTAALEEMHLILPNGRRLAGFLAFREIAKNLPAGWLIWPLLFIPGVPFVGARVYRLIARHRRRTEAMQCIVDD